MSEQGTASGVGFHGLTTETNACHFTWNYVNTLLCYTLVSVLDWYWVLVSAVDNTIGYWILGCFLGIVLTLYMIVSTRLLYVNAKSKLMLLPTVLAETNISDNLSRTCTDITVPVFPRFTTSSISASSVIVITLWAKLLTDVTLVQFFITLCHNLHKSLGRCVLAVL